VIIPSADADGTDFGIDAVWMIGFSVALQFVALIVVIGTLLLRR